MKNLKEIISERLHITKKTKTNIKNIKDPEKDTVAYDYNGDPWYIMDICQMNDIKSLNKFIKKYDDSGVFWDWYNDEFLNPDYDYQDKKDLWAVACEDQEYRSSITVWVWGYEGVCYANK